MLKGWRTMLFNLAVVVGGVVAYLASSSEFASAVPVKYVVAIGVANIVLRAITTGPVGSKQG